MSSFCPKPQSEGLRIAVRFSQKQLGRLEKAERSDRMEPPLAKSLHCTLHIKLRGVLITGVPTGRQSCTLVTETDWRVLKSVWTNGIAAKTRRAPCGMGSRLEQMNYAFPARPVLAKKTKHGMPPSLCGKPHLRVIRWVAEIIKTKPKKKTQHEGHCDGNVHPWL